MAAPRVLWVIPALFLLAQPLDVAAQGRGNKAKAAKGGGPAFCRSGAGHPVFGREWCRQRGWDATYRSTNRAISRDNERYGSGQQTNRFPWPF